MLAAVDSRPTDYAWGVQGMIRTSPLLAAASIAVATAFISAASAQWPPAQNTFPPAQDRDDPDPPPGKSSPKDKSKDKKKGSTAAGPNVSGVWAGQLAQVGSDSPYAFEIAIGQKLETKYAGLNCTGKLTRIGSSRSYVFFIEIITEGSAEKGGRCPDGTITVGRVGDKLAVSWFGSVKGDIISAHGALTKK
jgi:hypothetical protein